jgi:Cu-Zn family superoxide dismutase
VKMPMWLLVAALLLITPAPARAQRSAHADIMDSKGQKIGTAQLQQSSAGVRISLTASQLPPGTHGFHVHAVGKCDPPDFKTAGPHFNPDNKKHGAKNPDGPHAGDLFNIEVGADGTAHVTSLAPNVTLGAGPNSLFHEGGTSLVIHAQADDLMTDPSGNSGARIACGVIQK